MLAVGGGSSIDSAKAIAMGAANDGEVWDYFIGKRELTRALPVGTILTIPAAGSESSTSSVVTNEDGWIKRGFNSELIYPKFSVLNPELAFTLPKFQVACGSADIMSHLMERYFTNTRNVAFIDRMLEATMKTVIAQAPKVLAKPTDYDAWSELMWAGTIAHNNLLNTGRVGDWGSHDIEHEISGIYDVAHGAGLAVVFPAWMKHVLDHDLDRFVQWSVRVWNVELDIFDRQATARAGDRAAGGVLPQHRAGHHARLARSRRRPHRRDGEEGHRRRHAPHRQFRQARLRPGGEGSQARGLRRRAHSSRFDANRSSSPPAARRQSRAGAKRLRIELDDMRVEVDGELVRPWRARRRHGARPSDRRDGRGRVGARHGAGWCSQRSRGAAGRRRPQAAEANGR